jgi:DNA-binding transcriptional MerR regulator
MSSKSAPAYFGIGEVLRQLRPEFADVSTSKIRFLEAEGLIDPARSQSGYRRFAAADVDRLRYILTAQRDEYLPLRVIKERLDALEGASQSRQAAVTRSELLDAAGIDESSLAELEDYGLVRRTGRQYGQDALAVARTAAALSQFGVQARHLRTVKAAADREATLIEQVIAPQLRQRGPGARAEATAAAWQIAALTLQLHATLVEAALGEAGLGVRLASTAGAAETALGGAPEAATGGLRSASGR